MHGADVGPDCGMGVPRTKNPQRDAGMEIMKWRSADGTRTVMRQKNKVNGIKKVLANHFTGFGNRAILKIVAICWGIPKHYKNQCMDLCMFMSCWDDENRRFESCDSVCNLRTQTLCCTQYIKLREIGHYAVLQLCCKSADKVCVTYFREN